MNNQAIPISGHPDYFVTGGGKVLSAKGRKIRELIPGYCPKGYAKVTLSNGYARETKGVHRLVAEAFIPNPLNLPFVGHKNDNKADNRAANLYWTDPKENSTHNGVHLSIDRSHSFQASKEKFSIPVIGVNVEGQTVSFDSMREAEKHGFKNHKISECISGKRKTHRGYKWYKARDWQWRGPQEAGKGEAARV